MYLNTPDFYNIQLYGFPGHQPRGHSMKRAVLYLRVSTIDQTTANQERELRQIAERVGYDLLQVYKDQGVSGAKGRDQRPAFNSMCRAAARREFDVGGGGYADGRDRSLEQVIGFPSELH